MYCIHQDVCSMCKGCFIQIVGLFLGLYLFDGYSVEKYSGSQLFFTEFPRLTELKKFRPKFWINQIDFALEFYRFENTSFKRICIFITMCMRRTKTSAAYCIKYSFVACIRDAYTRKRKSEREEEEEEETFNRVMGEMYTVYTIHINNLSY